MGGDIDLYIVNTNVQHDPELICPGWNKSECREIMKEELYQHAFPSAVFMDVYKNRERYWNETVTKATTCKWCPKCALFAYDFEESPHLVAHHNIHHSYSNDIWMSRYFIKYLGIGSSNTEFEFEEEYRRGYTVYEWTLEHVTEALDKLKSPQDENEVDICAYEESVNILQFAKEALTKEADPIKRPRAFFCPEF
jgi:hypothetical protein